MKERLIKNGITSAIGLVLFGYLVYKFLADFEEFKAIEEIAKMLVYMTPYGIGALTGFLLFRSKDTWLISKAQGIANTIKPKKG